MMRIMVGFMGDGDKGEISITRYDRDIDWEEAASKHPAIHKHVDRIYRELLSISRYLHSDDVEAVTKEILAQTPPTITSLGDDDDADEDPEGNSN